GVIYGRGLTPTGTLTPTETISSAAGSIQLRHPSAAVDSTGDATIVWALLPPGGHGYQIEARQRALDGTLGAEVTVSGRHVRSPDIAVSPTGHAVAAWVRLTSDRVQASAGP